MVELILKPRSVCCKDWMLLLCLFRQTLTLLKDISVLDLKVKCSIEKNVNTMNLNANCVCVCVCLNQYVHFSEKSYGFHYI